MFVNRQDSTRLFWANKDLEPGMTVLVQTTDWYAVATVVRTAADEEVLVRTETSPTHYNGEPVHERGSGEYWVTATTVTQVLVPPTDFRQNKPY